MGALSTYLEISSQRYAPITHLHASSAHPADNRLIARLSRTSTKLPLPCSRTLRGSSLPLTRSPISHRWIIQHPARHRGAPTYTALLRLVSQFPPRLPLTQAARRDPNLFKLIIWTEPDTSKARPSRPRHQSPSLGRTLTQARFQSRSPSRRFANIHHRQPAIRT